MPHDKCQSSTLPHDEGKLTTIHNDVDKLCKLPNDVCQPTKTPHDECQPITYKIQDGSDIDGDGDCMEAVCHLGQDYPRGNCYKGKYISPEEAIQLKPNRDGGRVPALLYNTQMPGFDPIEQRDVWRHVVTNSNVGIGRKLFLQNSDGVIGQGHTLHIHHCVSKALKQIHRSCEYIIKNCGDVRSSDNWGGVGSMCPAGYHFHLGDVKQCAIKKGDVNKRRLMQSYLSDSGQIFTDQFANT